MISLIMRVGGRGPTGGRLQYTILVMEALARQQGAPPFEVVVVDNGTEDGTREWFSAIKREAGTSAYFPPFRCVAAADPANHLGPPKNFGDWGGMVHGAQHVSPKARVIGQLDNDIELPPTALAMCAGVLSTKMARVVMIKRRGVRQGIPMRGTPVRRVINGTAFGLQPVTFCVAFWLTAAANFKSAARYLNCRKFTESIGACRKILNLEALHIEGWEVNGPRSYLQKLKYDLRKWQVAREKGIL